MPVKPVTKEETPQEWLINEGYPLTMPMTRDNLGIIISRYAALQTAEKDARIKELEAGIQDVLNMETSGSRFDVIRMLTALLNRPNGV